MNAVKEAGLQKLECHIELGGHRAGNSEKGSEEEEKDGAEEELQKGSWCKSTPHTIAPHSNAILVHSHSSALSHYCIALCCRLQPS